MQVIRNPSCPKGAVLENNLFCLIICVLQVAQIHLVSSFSYSISLHLLLRNGRVLYFFSSIDICNSSTSLEASMQSFLFKKEKSNSKTGFPTVINLSGFCRHARIGLCIPVMILCHHILVKHYMLLDNMLGFCIQKMQPVFQQSCKASVFC